MKKFLVSVLAIAGLVACHNEEAVRMPEHNQAIAFDTFVENATRAAVDPSTTTTSIAAFDVWSWMDEKDGIVLTDENVTKNGNDWTYTNVQYWTPDHLFHFVAVAPMDSANWNYIYADDTIEFTNVDGTEDLLHDYVTVNTEDYTVNESYGAVALKFAHLLSKTKFTFQNGFATNNMYVEVSDIKMTAPKSATFDVETEAWGPVAEEISIAYGNVEKTSFGQKNESTYERFTIPASKAQEYVVTYTITIYRGTVEDYTVTKTSTITGIELMKGKAYNFVAEINPENLDLAAIEFEVEVIDWVNEDVDYGAIEETVKVVSTIEELQGVLTNANGDTSVVLGADLAGNVTINEVANATIAINGNGHTFEGYMYINGNSADDKNAVTVFDNIQFVTNDSSAYPGTAFIYCGEGLSTNDRYPNSIVVKDCSFVDNSGSTDPKTVAVKFWSLYDKLVIENSTATGLHSLVQATSTQPSADILIEGVKVEAKNGISVDNTTNTIIRNSEIVASGYGIRANGDRADKAGLIIENTTIEAVQPVIVRKVTSTKYTLNVDEDTVLNNTGLYDVVFTKGSDSAAYVAPDVDFTFNGPADLLVFPNVIVADNAETLAAALTATNKNINVVLANDIDLPINTLGQQTGGSGEYKLGGEATEAITIDLNDKKLNVTTTYWSALGAKNNNALFTIKNGSMTSTGNNAGAWNAWDLRFSNCNYVFENVVFEKAVALDNVAKSTVMTGVTITDTHNTDTYGLWITAEGQTVTLEDCEIDMTPATDGRGIKIDEQYVDAPAKVTLNVANTTFKTDEKAAILVKSVAGAEINVENINIDEVAADNKFAVWVDEDAAAHADKVVVNGALVKVEGSADAVVATTDALKDAIDNGAKAVYLADGTYTLASYPAGLEIVGFGDNVILDVTGKKYGVNGDVTIENVKLVFSDANYTGFQHTNVEYYKNCTIVGQPFLYGNNVTFEGCTFEQDSADAYNVWTYGAKNVKFIDCVFNCAGKSVLIYTESGDGQKVVFEGCTLNASAPVDGKAAIEIDSSLIKGAYEIEINNTTANGFANGNVSGNSLWNNKKGNKATITVDGVKVL